MIVWIKKCKKIKNPRESIHDKWMISTILFISV